ncbi:hypothetical protein N7493_011690 [Penicillium malachiteum]|uniref:Uncharacterized protein n=1 Tax=Penicillium malachiteum TaxID=1324776 RepID=A0AAD6HA97_9EURO|nr:hypothetical protein N7493_011690 [Penicillium malachiteum]
MARWQYRLQEDDLNFFKGSSSPMDHLTASEDAVNRSRATQEKVIVVNGAALEVIIAFDNTVY